MNTPRGDSTGGAANPPRSPWSETQIAPPFVLSPAERHRLLVEWNNTATEYPRDKCLHQLFEEQVVRTPEAVAVVCGNQSLTYQQLNQRANQLAHHLHKMGVGPAVLVGLCLERSLDLLVGLLAILKAGGAYVPIDPSYPKDRVAFMLADAQVPFLLTQTKLLAKLPTHQAKVISLDGSDPSALDLLPNSNQASRTQPEQPAYVIYTSGSTGNPKGVMVEHRAIVNHLAWRQRVFPLNNEDRFLHKASLSFDISVWEIFAPLISGARLVVARPNGQQDFRYLAGLMTQCNVTVAHFSPAALDLLVAEPGFAGCRTLRLLFCGGEPLSRRLQKQFFGLSKAELISQYGPTETTVDVTWYRCNQEDATENAPIGCPIANTQVYVLDAARKPVPIGVRGEIYIGGDSLARGYLNRPELTAERFIPDPFSQKDGARLFRTGDLGRYLPDGNLEFLGRIDHQVKLRGFRIELGEIESVLTAHPNVQSAIVNLREDQPGEKYLAAYVVPKVAPSPTSSDLREFLQTKLPDYMIPAAFVALDQQPLTHNGKIDRKALPAPTDQDRLGGDPPYAAPRTSTQEKLAAIWAEVLGRQRIGIHDNFFHLGGHSLLATRVVSRIAQRCDITLPLRLLFEKPTIADLGVEVEALQAAETEGFLQMLEGMSEEEARKLLGE